MDMTDDFLSMLGGMVKDWDNYEARKVGRNEVNGVTVSTCYASDAGYETAILDAVNVYPVERYANRQAAEDGHKRWMLIALDIETITDVGYGESIAPKVILLQRRQSDDGTKGSSTTANERTS